MKTKSKAKPKSATVKSMGDRRALVRRAASKTPRYTIGIDMGDRRHAVCVLDRRGEIVAQPTVANNREALAELAAEYPKARAVIEVGSHSPWVSRHLTERGLEVIVANPRKVRAIFQSDRKSDEHDAEQLARIGRTDPRLLHPVEHVGEREQRDLLRVKLRDNLVRQRVDIISSVRFTLKSLGLWLPSPNTNCFAKAARAILAEEDPELLDMVAHSLAVIDAMTEQIRKLTREIERLCEEVYPETALLSAIRGVGPVTALTFVLTVGDPSRCDKARDVGAFLGLVPKRDQSGNCDKELGISKGGNAYLRRLLVGCAQYMLGPFGEECDLRRHGLELASRGGRGAKKKAVVAIARKLAVVMLSLWKNGTDYEPVRNPAKAA